jgi:hypothetical protein
MHKATTIAQRLAPATSKSSAENDNLPYQ